MSITTKYTMGEETTETTYEVAIKDKEGKVLSFLYVKKEEIEFLKDERDLL